MTPTLRIGAAFGDPPFNGADGGGGLDISLMQEIGELLSLAVDVTRHPQVCSTDDLNGLTIGVQQGNTSRPIAEALVAQGKAKAVRVYDYGTITTAIADLTTGGCDAVMKLAPVLTELVRPVDGVEVVQRGISTERIATAVRRSDGKLLHRINAAQDELEKTGRLPQLRQTWLGSALLDQSGERG